jgi:hypothetical protein
MRFAIDVRADALQADHAGMLLHLCHPDITVWLWQANKNLVAGNAEV